MSLMNLIFIVYQVIAIVAVIHVVMDNRQPAKTMSWALVIYFIPVAGIMAYFFFGRNTRKERFVSKRSLDQLTRRSMLKFAEQTDLKLPETYKPLIDLFVNESFSLPFNGNRTQLLTDGYQFFPTLLRDIAKAKSHIHIDVYIFEDDPLGQLIADGLIARAKAGVEVRIIYDDVGCWSVKGRFFERMREAGIEVAPFLPVRFPQFTSKANYRNHRKLIVIDGNIGYIGGMNIALRYVKGNARKGKRHDTERMPWRDTMARIEGRGVFTLQRTFLIDWYFTDRTLLSDRKYYPTENGALNTSNLFIQTVTSGPTSPYPEIMQGYVRTIIGARRYVYLQTPYFLPTEAILLALKTAVISGVDVRLMVPLYGDTWLTSWASRSYLREVAEAGVRVSLYKAGFLHSKLMVCDDMIATCGSTNIDFRSFENNFEANSFFYGEDIAVRMRDIYLVDEQQSVPLTSLPDRMSPRFTVRLWESLTRLFSPLL
jgi:cardiolipin synthase